MVIESKQQLEPGAEVQIYRSNWEYVDGDKYIIATYLRTILVDNEPHGEVLLVSGERAIFPMTHITIL